MTYWTCTLVSGVLGTEESPCCIKERANKIKAVRPGNFFLQEQNQASTEHTWPRLSVSFIPQAGGHCVSSHWWKLDVTLSSNVVSCWTKHFDRKRNKQGPRRGHSVCWGVYTHRPIKTLCSFETSKNLQICKFKSSCVLG